MTTIAYRDGILAADGLMVRGNMVVSTCERKLEYVDCFGWWVAPCGCASEIEVILNWMRSGADQGKKPKIEGEGGLMMIQVDSRGNVQHWDKDLMPYENDQPFHAIGIGEEIAIGAMEAGSSAEEAVRIACARNIYTGGDVQVVNVFESPKALELVSS